MTGVSLRRRCCRRRLKGHLIQVRHKKEWGRDFILLLPQIAVLPGSDPGSDVLSHHRVSLSKTVIPRVHFVSNVWGTLVGRGLRFVQWRRTCDSVKEQDSFRAWTNGIVQHQITGDRA